MEKEKKRYKRAVHYFGSSIYNSFHHDWYYFKVECGITISRKFQGQRMVEITNKKEKITCGNCLKLMNLPLSQQLKGGKGIKPKGK